MNENESQLTQEGVMQQNCDSTQFPSIPHQINVGGMILWGLLGAPIGLFVGFFTGALISMTAFWITIILFIVVLGFMGAKSQSKEERKAQAARQFISNEGLTQNEKITAWIFNIMNPVITGAVMYYMWRNRYPAKARQANHLSIIVCVVELVIAGVLTFLILQSSSH